MEIYIIAIFSLAGVLLFDICAESNAYDSIFQDYGFPSHPGLTHLCQQRVYALDREIIWDAFASDSMPTQLINYYRQKLGDKGFTKEGGGGTWRLPAGAPQPNRVLDIMTVGVDAPYRSCEKSPPPNSRSIIMISRMFSKKK